MLDLPTPEGPASTINLPLRAVSVPLNAGPSGWRRSCSLLEVGEKRLALAVTEATQPTRRCDLQPLHDLGGAHLADARHRLEQRGDLHLAEHVVRVGLLQHLGHADATALETLLQLSPDPARLGGLRQRSGTLFLGQLGKGHGLLRLSSAHPVRGASFATDGASPRGLRRTYPRPPPRGKRGCHLCVLRGRPPVEVITHLMRREHAPTRRRVSRGGGCRPRERNRRTSTATPRSRPITARLRTVTDRSPIGPPAATSGSPPGHGRR